MATTAERFDYLYKPAQLQEWVPAIQAASEQGVPVHVLMNNNASNYAVANAFDMAALLGLPAPRPPRPVLETMRARDQRVPEWVERAQPVVDEAGSDEAGDQLTLTL